MTDLDLCCADKRRPSGLDDATRKGHDDLERARSIKETLDRTSID